MLRITRRPLNILFVSRDCKSAIGLHGPINLAPKHTAEFEQWKMSAGTYIYTHPTCLIRRQQWHNKSWRLQSRLPGRVRQTDRPSNAFIIILNHIFSSLSLPRAFIPPRSKYRRFRPPRSPSLPALQFNAISSLFLSSSPFLSRSPPRAVVLRI